MGQRNIIKIFYAMLFKTEVNVVFLSEHGMETVAKTIFKTADFFDTRSQ